MCTVTYIPQGKNGFILTSNRDESPARSPKNITTEQVADVSLAFPRDSGAGGTWIAISNEDKMVCLLNGAYEKHIRKTSYKKSRGVMVLEFFDYITATSFFKSYDFDGMEPFTMVVYDQGKLFELIWDELTVTVNKLDPKGFYIWSSSTLYDQEVKHKRKQWFNKWLEKQESFDLDNILDFHFNAGDGDPENDVMMNRNGIVQTVSVTNIVRQVADIEMIYHDLLNTQKKQVKITLKGEVVGSH